MSTLLQQATELHNKGHLAAAEALYRSVLVDDPQQADALALLGVLRAGRKDFDEALSLLHRAIKADPSTPLFHLYLGEILLSMGQNDRAANAFQEALLRQPNLVDAHIKLAILFEKQNDLAKAIYHLHHATRLQPDNGTAWIKLSEVAFKCTDFDQAQKSAEIATRIMPEALASHIAYALALDALDHEEDALEALERAIQIQPDFVQAWDMMGSIYQRLGMLREAETIFLKSLEIIGCPLPSDGAIDVSEEDYRVQHWNLALLELLRGDFRRGFAHYRARFKKTGRAQRLPFPQPVWAGEDLGGKKILVVGEQGFGDVLMLCRYVPILGAKGARVVLLAPPALVDLLKRAKIADDVISEAPSEQGDFDYQTSLFDLPYRLGTRLETIPGAPYLPSPSPSDTTVLPASGRPRVGVVWAGKKEFGNDRRRSIPLTVFADLFDETSVQFFNLTRDLLPGDKDLLAHSGVTDLASKLDNFLTTARFLSQLDLVITCDTAVAHLAGGMGKKVWVLVPFAPDWRWLTNRDNSPWYPAMRLFRQSKRGDWPEVLARVRAELAALFAPPPVVQPPVAPPQDTQPLVLKETSEPTPTPSATVPSAEVTREPNAPEENISTENTVAPVVTGEGSDLLEEEPLLPLPISQKCL